MPRTLDDIVTDLQLDTEDIVLETWQMLKERYDGTMRKVLDIIALWWMRNDIRNLTDAQNKMPELMEKLDGIMDVECEERISDMTELFAQVYEFNALYARKNLEIEEDEEDYTLLFTLLGLSAVVWQVDGLTYSERLRLRNSQLKDAVKSIILRASVSGGKGADPSPIGTKKLLREIRHELSKQKYSGAGTLIDEATHWANEGVRRASEGTFNGYRISTVLDGKRCEHCASMEGKQFLWSEYQPGITAPLFHSRCRCRAIPIEIKN